MLGIPRRFALQGILEYSSKKSARVSFLPELKSQKVHTTLWLNYLFRGQSYINFSIKHPTVTYPWFLLLTRLITFSLC